MNQANKICEYLKNVQTAPNVFIQAAYIEAFMTAISKYITDNHLESCESIVNYKNRISRSFGDLSINAYFASYSREVLTDINDPDVKIMLLYVFSN